MRDWGYTHIDRKLGEINDQLSALSNDPDQPPSQSMLRAIQRHRDVYQDYAKELKRTKVSISAVWKAGSGY